MEPLESYWEQGACRVSSSEPPLQSHLRSFSGKQHCREHPLWRTCLRPASTAYVLLLLQGGASQIALKRAESALLRVADTVDEAVVSIIDRLRFP